MGSGHSVFHNFISDISSYEEQSDSTFKYWSIGYYGGRVKIAILGLYIYMGGSTFSLQHAEFEQPEPYCVFSGIGYENVLFSGVWRSPKTVKSSQHPKSVLSVLHTYFFFFISDAL